MRHTINKHDQYVTIKLHEPKLNSLISPELKSQLIFMNSQEGYKNIILDLEETQYCDSSGLSAILVGNRICKNSSGSFILAGLPDTIKKLITISQLDQVLTITPTVNEAVDYIFMDELEKDLPTE
jgi:anti-anti-sigma factor